MSYNTDSRDMNGMTGADYASLAQQSTNDNNKKSLQYLKERIDLLEYKFEHLLEVMNLKFNEEEYAKVSER